MTHGLKCIVLVHLGKSLHLTRESGDSVVSSSMAGSVEAATADLLWLLLLLLVIIIVTSIIIIVIREIIPLVSSGHKHTSCRHRKP